MSVRAAICLVLVLAGPAAASEPDYAREERLAAQIVDAIFDGDPEWLTADGRRFLGIYAEPDDPTGGIVILHGRGFHPDWADTVNPLRVGLLDHGYATLSLQMPVLAKDARYYDYLPIMGHAHGRIEAGIRFLRERGFERVVLVAHSCGVHMAMDWIADRGDGRIDAFAGLGMGATDLGQPMPKAFPFDSLRVPVLDLYGADEYPAVTRAAPRRRVAIESAGNPRSRQAVLPGADHYFTGRGDALVSVVAEWLESLD